MYQKNTTLISLLYWCLLSRKAYQMGSSTSIHSCRACFKKNLSLDFTEKSTRKKQHLLFCCLGVCSPLKPIKWGAPQASILAEHVLRNIYPCPFWQKNFSTTFFRILPKNLAFISRNILMTFFSHRPLF